MWSRLNIMGIFSFGSLFVCAYVYEKDSAVAICAYLTVGSHMVLLYSMYCNHKDSLSIIGIARKNPFTIPNLSIWTRHPCLLLIPSMFWIKMITPTLKIVLAIFACIVYFLPTSIKQPPTSKNLSKFLVTCLGTSTCPSQYYQLLPVTTPLWIFY